MRLVVNCSKLEPQRGAISEAYLDEIAEAVSNAADYGIYTIIDMHQDAFSASIFTEDADECPAGTQPGKGWDGAPQQVKLILLLADFGYPLMANDDDYKAILEQAENFEKHQVAGQGDRNLFRPGDSYP